MFNASEAADLAIKKSGISGYLAWIELNIKQQAGYGKFYTSFAEEITEDQKNSIVRALENAGYIVKVKSGSPYKLYHFYIYW